MSVKIDMASLRVAFFHDAVEHLGLFEEAVLVLEKNPSDAEAINAAFRAVHTIKGSGGIFPFPGLLDFAHHMESFLERIRDGHTQIRPELFTLLLESLDQLRRLTVHYESGAEGPVPGDLAAISTTLHVRCQQYVAEADLPTAVVNEPPVFLISLRPDVFRLGLSLEAAMAYLVSLGKVASVRVDPHSVPCYDDFKALEPFLQLSVTFKPGTTNDEGHAMLNDAFEMLLPQLNLHLQEVSLPEKQISLPTDKAAHANLQLVKVEGARLDNLLNLMGEIAMKDGSLKRLLQDKRLRALTKPFKELSRLIDDARDLALQLRMVSVAGLFRKVERIARDAAQKTGKEVTVRFIGQETELDRVLLDKLQDPLLHIIRNAVDHGIEKPDERIRHGKPKAGIISLEARQKTGVVEIDISDDGRGLDADKILRKALDKGLANPDKKYQEPEIFNFIFEPGFSTKDEASQISGRGVGMDVVRQNIESVRGAVVLDSRSGEGTRVHLRLPVTLALIDGFLVSSAGEKFLIPLEAMKECIDFRDYEKDINPRRSAFIDLRGEVLPFIRLHEFFNLEPQKRKRESLIVVEIAEARFGVVVDEPLGECHVVVKAFSGFLSGTRGISGASMLGVGDIALVLDLAGIYHKIRRRKVA